MDLSNDLEEPLQHPGSERSDVQADDTCKPILYALTAGLGAFLFGYTLGFTSPTLAAMRGDVLAISNCTTDSSGQITAVSLESDWYSSLVNIGCALGALLGSSLTTKAGRKNSIILAMIPFIGSFVGTALFSQFWLLLILRIITGMAVGVVSMAVPLYIAETAPPTLRGTLGAITQFGVVIGIFAVSGIGLLMPHVKNSDVPHSAQWNPMGNYSSGTTFLYCDPNQESIGSAWRTLSWIGAGFSGVAALCMLLAPKTPHWLVSQLRYDEARESLQILRGERVDVNRELDTLRDGGNDNTEDATIADLFEPGTKEPFVIMLMMMLFQQLSGINAVIFFSGSIFHAAGSTHDDLNASIVMGMQIVFTAVSMLLVDRLGRKVLLSLSLSGISFFASVLGVFFYINRNTPANPQYGWLALVSLIGYIVSFSMGLGAIPWILMGEMFPSRARGLASGIATCFNWILSFVVTVSFSYLMLHLTKHGTFWLFGAICALGVVFTQTQVVETKGRTLEEIESYFLKKSQLQQVAEYEQIDR